MSVEEEHCRFAVPVPDSGKGTQEHRAVAADKDREAMGQVCLVDGVARGRDQSEKRRLIEEPRPRRPLRKRGRQLEITRIADLVETGESLDQLCVPKSMRCAGDRTRPRIGVERNADQLQVHATLVRSIFAQPDRDAVLAQFDRVVDQLAERFPAAAEMLADAGPDILAFTAFPQTQWKQIWSNNPQERLNKEIRRRTDVVGIFPNRAAAVRLVGMVLAEQHDEWQVVRRYMSAESLAKARLEVIEGEAVEEVKGELVAAG